MKCDYANGPGQFPANTFAIGFLNCSLFTQVICNSVCMGYIVGLVRRILVSFVLSYLVSFCEHSSTSPEAL